MSFSISIEFSDVCRKFTVGEAGATTFLWLRENPELVYIEREC